MDPTKDIYSIFNVKNADFFNINVKQDTAKFVQPYTVESLSSEIARKCDQTSVDFFNTVHELLLKKDKSQADKLFSSYLKEPRENCLGYTGESTSGKGLKEMAHYAMEQILGNPFLINEITKIADLQLYIRKIMHDRVSDLYTNVVRNELNDYTLEQCKKYNMMHLVEEKDFGPYWDSLQHRWRVGEKKKMLVVDEKPILLTPKSFLTGSYGPNAMYNNVVLPKWIDEDLRKNESSLIKRRKNGETYISKKDKRQEMKSLNFVPSKEEMVKFARINPGCTRRLRLILEDARQKRLKNKVKRKVR